MARTSKWLINAPQQEDTRARTHTAVALPSPPAPSVSTTASPAVRASARIWYGACALRRLPIRPSGRWSGCIAGYKAIPPKAAPARQKLKPGTGVDRTCSRCCPNSCGKFDRWDPQLRISTSLGDTLGCALADTARQGETAIARQELCSATAYRRTIRAFSSGQPRSQTEKQAVQVLAKHPPWLVPPRLIKPMGPYP